jgi:hypothetical protein
MLKYVSNKEQMNELRYLFLFWKPKLEESEMANAIKQLDRKKRRTPAHTEKSVTKMDR